MWIIALLVVGLVLAFAFRSKNGRQSGSFDTSEANRVETMLNSTDSILSSGRRLERTFPQLRAWLDDLDEMGSIFRSYSGADSFEQFWSTAKPAIEKVVATGEQVSATLPDEAKAAMAEYADSCRHLLRSYAHVAPLAQPARVPDGRSDQAVGEREDGGVFEVGFERLSALLGTSEPAILAAMGRPDQTYTNDGGARFLFYERCKSVVTLVSDGRVPKNVSAPCADARGRPLTASDGTWLIRGAKVGDSRAAVASAWGEASEQSEFVAVYADPSWSTQSGGRYTIAAVFDRDGEDRVAEFKARLG